MADYPLSLAGAAAAIGEHLHGAAIGAFDLRRENNLLHGILLVIWYSVRFFFAHYRMMGVPGLVVKNSIINFKFDIAGSI